LQQARSGRLVAAENNDMADNAPSEALEVIHDPSRERFELRIGDEVGLLEYRRSPGKMAIYHTEVPEQFQRRGYAARLTRAALDFASAEKLQVEPRCSYAAFFLQKHREYEDLLVPG
jgi:predicted GNAT family acetyltransferase